MLYPIATESRKLISLDGIWRFKLDKITLDETQVGLPLKDYLNMPVPCSYNDIPSDNKIRNHQGWVWYERDLVIQADLLKERLLIRFGSATHKARLYLNGKFLLEHIGGFTPFEIELNDLVKTGKNLLQIAVNNQLDLTTIPVGMVSGEGENRKSQGLFDFFNYAGIHRPVKLYTTPTSYLKDITLDTSFTNNTGIVKYHLDYVGSVIASVDIRDEEGNIVASASGADGTIEIENVHLWQPLNAYLYNFEVTLKDNEKVIDTYELPFGVRTVRIDGKKFLINEKPFYFKVFGKHEDFHVHGRGFDEAVNAKDIGLLKWLGANSYRTAHYPYSEEMMRLSAKEGIVVIDEVAAVGLMVGMGAFMGSLLGTGGTPPKTWEITNTTANHRDAIEQLVLRDKNNPAVVMWSIANEPDTHEEGAVEYFQPLIKLCKDLDIQKRPVTIVTHLQAVAGADLIHPYIDVLCLNRYYGWYLDGGNLEAAETKLRGELTGWSKIEANKPIIFTEYGADTVAGLHDVHDIMFTEEYQVKYYEMNHRVFDDFDQVVGEQAWNFADFEVWQGVIRVQGNKKGFFTRQREPKAIASEVRKRWHNIPDFNYKK
ncbi:MAG: beta-glucuronidase [Erysipelotrichaceae bacterium]